MASSIVASSSSRARSALESFFTPASVAVIGATDREGSVGRTILMNLVHSGYRGRLVWWAIGMILAAVYFTFVYRSFAGKVAVDRDSHGYGDS